VCTHLFSKDYEHGTQECARPLSFAREHFKERMFDFQKQRASPKVRQSESQRSHECERGTQECVRYNDVNNLQRPGKN
jgi:hypothetical protein